MDYKEKYFKYKSKYLNLKNRFGGMPKKKKSKKYTQPKPGPLSKKEKKKIRKLVNYEFCKKIIDEQDIRIFDFLIKDSLFMWNEGISFIKYLIENNKNKIIDKLIEFADKNLRKIESVLEFNYNSITINTNEKCINVLKIGKRLNKIDSDFINYVISYLITISNKVEGFNLTKNIFKILKPKYNFFYKFLAEYEFNIEHYQYFMKNYTDLDFKQFDRDDTLLYNAVSNNNKTYFKFLKNIINDTRLNKNNNDIIDIILYKEKFDFIDEFYQELKNKTLVNIHDKYIDSKKYILSGHGQITRDNKYFVVPENVILVFLTQMGVSNVVSGKKASNFNDDFKVGFYEDFDKLINYKLLTHNARIYTPGSLCFNHDIDFQFVKEKEKDKFGFSGIITKEDYLRKVGSYKDKAISRFSNGETLNESVIYDIINENKVFNGDIQFIFNQFGKLSTSSEIKISNLYKVLNNRRTIYDYDDTKINVFYLTLCRKCEINIIQKALTDCKKKYNEDIFNNTTFENLDKSIKQIATIPKIKRQGSISNIGERIFSNELESLDKSNRTRKIIERKIRRNELIDFSEICDFYRELQKNI